MLALWRSICHDFFNIPLVIPINDSLRSVFLGVKAICIRNEISEACVFPRRIPRLGKGNRIGATSVQVQVYPKITGVRSGNLNWFGSSKDEHGCRKEHGKFHNGGSERQGNKVDVLESFKMR